MFKGGKGLEIAEMEIERLKEISRNIRMDIIEEIYAAQSGHPGGALSCTDILTVLYFNQMNINPNRKDD